MTKQPHGVKDADDRPVLAGELDGLVNQALELVDCFGNESCDLRQRWNDRIVLERSSLAELYIDGRIELVLYGDWIGGVQNHEWVCRIVAETGGGTSDKRARCESATDPGDCNYGQDQIVLVVIVEVVESPKRFIRSILRANLIEKHVLGSGDGLLYRRESGGGYKTFPFWSDWEKRLRIRIDRPNNTRGKMIQSGAQVVHHVPNNERENFRNWVDRHIPDTVALISARGARFNGNGVEVFGQGLAMGAQFVNVAVGPLNL